MNPFIVGISFKRYVLYVEIWCENMVLNKDDFLYYFYTHMKLDMNMMAKSCKPKKSDQNINSFMIQGPNHIGQTLESSIKQ